MAQGRNPRDVKFELAREIVARFHGDAQARAAQERFVAQFQKGVLPDDIPEIRLQGAMPLANLLKDAGLTASTSEAMRMVKQGAVKIDGEKVSDARLTIEPGFKAVVQVGKRRFARVTIGQG